jgi:hypothetical protein
MIENRVFTDVPISVLEEIGELDEITRLIDEDLLLRRDISKESKDILSVSN